MRRAYDELLQSRITSRHIHVLANHSVALEQLPEAFLLQSSDVVHSLECGVALGGATGALLGLVALVYPPAELAIAGGAVVALTLAGTGFGAWTATMIGVEIYCHAALREFIRAWALDTKHSD